MKKIIFIFVLLLVGCTTSYEIEEYKANVYLQDSSVIVYQTYYQTGQELILDYSLVEEDYNKYKNTEELVGIIFTRERILLSIEKPFDDLCIGPIGC